MPDGRASSSSLGDALQLATKIASGELGTAAKTAFLGHSLALDALCATTAPTTKEAVADDSTLETDEEARKRRLAELLRRREPSGLATGSANPSPPRGNT